MLFTKGGAIKLPRNTAEHSWSTQMNKSCTYCGKTHPVGFICPKKPVHSHDKDDRNAAFRRTSRWKHKAESIKQRDLYLCRMCLASGIINDKDLSVHHIIPLSEDFEQRLDDDNLITLCSECHRKAESGEIERTTLAELVKTAPGVRWGDFSRSGATTGPHQNTQNL